jgi:hypothetical protein
VAGSRRPVEAGDFSRADLERLGFVGFVPVRELLASRPIAAAIPNDAVGVYVAFRDSAKPVAFMRA